MCRVIDDYGAHPAATAEGCCCRVLQGSGSQHTCSGGLHWVDSLRALLPLIVTGRRAWGMGGALGDGA